MNELPVLARGPERCTLQVHPTDAERLGLDDGGRALIRSRVGALEAPVEVTEHVRPGVVSLPHGWTHTNSNVLSDELLVEPITGTAVLNGIPVDVVPVPAAEPVATAG
jgi:anaerobic selenocysteine-containing dehydrogenase